ncbi:MAG: ABC transporter ATP-binding protein [Rhodospirillaceae bacterium]|nr:ABC transporter ATP-binding protein [Rhodospirillaceae bacterium]
MTAAPDAHVRLRGVVKVFTRPGRPGDTVHALGPVDLDLRAGEFFAVVGPSGCGKSTLLEIIAGLSVASEGEVTFEGGPVRGQVPEGVGVVFQEDATFPWLSVSDNIGFGLRRMRMPAAERRTRIARALSMTGLEPFAHSYPAQLSGGMRQRVCIARTLVMEPRLILLDEPFGALDQQTRLLMGDEILNLWRKTRATVFLITHALDEAAMLADRIAVMSARPGCIIDIVATGWPKDRDSRIVQEERFGAITARLWRSLRRESLRAMGRPEAA